MIIGGGAAGFFSAIHNKQNHPDCDVIIIEKSKDVLAKVNLSGGGRCNVTHACFDPNLLCNYYPRGAKEMRGPFFAFQPKDTMAWFESHGVPLKIEPDNRVFPVSNKAQSISRCLVETATQLGIKIWTECPVNSVIKEGSDFILLLENNQKHRCQKLVLATGSGRTGYKFAKQFGHTIVEPIPSLFTFKINDNALHTLRGLSVENTHVWIEGHKKQIQMGPTLITHWGVSGPAIIKLSAWQAKLFHGRQYQLSIKVNWLPHFKEKELKQYLIQFKTKAPKKCVITQCPFTEIATRLWGYLVLKSKSTNTTTWSSLSPKQIDLLIQELTHCHYEVTGKSPFKEEFVTCGGVSLKEVHFKTMESKVCGGLHIVGELLDIDGVTGGFNFQNAWTTGFLSGQSKKDKK